MPYEYLRTSDLAKAAKVHPNTVRLYEEWGLLPPVQRDPSNNYRLFTEKHLDQILLVRSSLPFNIISSDIRSTVYELIDEGAQDNPGGALELAYKLVSQIQSEQTRGEAAADYLQRWADGTPTEISNAPLHIGDVARLLDVSIDQLRNWERNGLISVPRDSSNGYRLYGSDEIGRLRVIRMLIWSHYSTMSILRMVNKLDVGEIKDLRSTLDTPEPEEDVLYVTDQWLTTLAEMEQAAHKLIAQIEDVISKRHAISNKLP
ncbi:MAG: MerR family DNA-binding transcriptional regulator [Chloroflexi bacterium]|nr:MAG: MerR family DNA-binding transcriptional regulator [Chloroflexota bacterium]MBL1197161.1 MerR family DNA-binding transcriptional regulator [Chloroflexota bacterium]NOH14456.1 MerR family DNA-binding transcriptional regulator [Chloroflexota bacterium]